MGFKRVLFFLIIFGLILVIGIIFFQQFLSRKETVSPKTVLFLCVHNSFRSQIAEAYFNKFSRERNLNWQAESAGFLGAEKVNERAIVLMKEEGIDISNEKPKLMTEKMLSQADKIIVVCKECEELGLCLNLPQHKDIDYWRFENPAQLELDKAREIRDLIKEKILNLIETLEKK